MFFKKKLDECKVYCLERNIKVAEVDERNKMTYEFIFSIVEPSELNNKPWTEYLDEPNRYTVGQYYRATYNSKTGEVNILEVCERD